jgi:SulP family sulfate permease
MSILDELKKEFQLKVLLPSITVGLIISTIGISVEVSLAAFIFSGSSLSRFVAGGIGLLLFGGFVIAIVTAFTTSLPGTMALPQDTPAAILALVAAGIALRMQASAPEAVYATVVAAIALTSLLMGAIFILLGHFRASGFVRYIPYPVVGGFLAGTGWLLVKGAFGVMLNMPVTLANLPEFLAVDRLIVWGPGLAFGLALLFVLRRYNHFLITPGGLLLMTALFYGFLALSRIPVAEASARGWLLGPFPAGGFYQPLSPAFFANVDWGAVLGQGDKIATALVLSMIAMLLNTSALEVTVHQDIDLNRELRTAGLANLAGALGGSPVGYQTLGMSALAYRLGARSRLVSLVAGGVCGVALFFGASLFSFFPKVVLGGMLLYLGLGFLAEWLVDARRHLPGTDYVLVWVILVIIAGFGFLQGIGAGVVIAAILFVITYSRVNIIRNVLSGQVFHSNVDRPKAHRDLLMERGAEIHILRLQGFIFFGTIQSILSEIRRRLNDTRQPKLRYVVLDFQRVTRLDSSAVFGIMRLRQLAQANGILMVWTQVSQTIQGQLERGGLVDKNDDSFVMLPTLDYGVEWCENKMLVRQGSGNLTAVIERVEGQLRRAFPGLQAADRLVKYLERREVANGEYLMRQGDPPSEMYFVESGMVTVQLETEAGQSVRLRSMRGGTTVGEMGMYLGAPRTASVVASRPSVVYRLSAESLARMSVQDPEVAALLHEWIARLLAERLTITDRTIEALLD